CVGQHGVDGEVIFVDDFGNLITNIEADALPRRHEAVRGVSVGEVRVDRYVRTYGEAPPGSLVALVSSGGTLEVAVVQGSAARRLSALPGAPVFVEVNEPQDSPQRPGARP